MKTECLQLVMAFRIRKYSTFSFDSTEIYLSISLYIFFFPGHSDWHILTWIGTGSIAFSRMHVHSTTAKYDPKDYCGIPGMCQHWLSLPTNSHDQFSVLGCLMRDLFKFWATLCAAVWEPGQCKNNGNWLKFSPASPHWAYFTSFSFVIKLMKNNLMESFDFSMKCLD